MHEIVAGAYLKPFEELLALSTVADFHQYTTKLCITTTPTTSPSVGKAQVFVRVVNDSLAYRVSQDGIQDRVESPPPMHIEQHRVC
jgi:uncharacterized protein YqiB (DUF1249 family)